MYLCFGSDIDNIAVRFWTAKSKTRVKATMVFSGILHTFTHTWYKVLADCVARSTRPCWVYSCNADIIHFTGGLDLVVRSKMLPDRVCICGWISSEMLECSIPADAVTSNGHHVPDIADQREWLVPANIYEFWWFGSSQSYAETGYIGRWTFEHKDGIAVQWKSFILHLP